MPSSRPSWSPRASRTAFPRTTPGPGSGSWWRTKPDGAQHDPGTASERNEARQRLRSALDALPASEREAIELTHLAGMTHAVAAEALRLPRQTLGVRIQRGLDRLSKRLRSEPARVGSALAVLPIAAPPMGWEAATATWGEAAVGALSVPTAATSTLAGGIALMSSKTLLVLTLTAAIGVGFLGGTLTTSSKHGESVASGPDASLALMSADSGSSGSPILDSPIASASGNVADLRREIVSLRNRLTEMQAAKAASDEKLALVEAPSTAPTFTFGALGQLDAVREANWQEMAQSAVIVTQGVLDIVKTKERGETVPREVYLRLQENIEKMRKYEYRTIGKMPTAAKHNGELTHPITVANLIAAILADVELPLSEEQVMRINRLGLAFESEFGRLRERYSDATPRIQRLLDEYELKGRFTDDVIAVLTPEQQAKVADPETKGIAGIDLSDPTLMIIHTSPVLVGQDLDEITSKLQKLIAKKLELAETELPALEGPITAWSQDVRDLLTPVPQARLTHYTFADGVAAGRATLSLTTRLLRELQLTETARSALLDDYAIYVPRILKL
jgi:hypothetical protein